ncbi:hypothetical protein AX15_000791 [Amanita polypyramis BW_CC]|nr:hypothetical protein AX15_000791 [Amanita polypyramis BW_CC]
MPIAPFTIDSRFKLEAIGLAEVATQQLLQCYSTPKKESQDMPENNISTFASVELPYTKNLRKRAMEENTADRVRMVKTRRICTPGKSPTTLGKPCPRSPLSGHMRESFLVGHGDICDSSSSSRLDMTGTTMIDQRIEFGDVVDSSDWPRTDITKHLTFWEDLCGRRQPGSALNLQIMDVLRAPKIHPAIFCRGGEYMGKHFRIAVKDPKEPSTIADQPSRSAFASAMAPGQTHSSQHHYCSLDTSS